MIYVLDLYGTPPWWRLKRFDKGQKNEEVQVCFSLSVSTQVDAPEMLDDFKAQVAVAKTRWLTPGFEEWTLDLDALREEFPELSALRWFKGKVARKPEVTFTEPPHVRERRRLGIDSVGFSLISARVTLRIVPEVVKKAVMLAEAPLGIHHSLAHFRLDFPKPEEVAFVIMRFGTTDAHTLILEGIKKALGAAGLSGIRADERHYHDDLFNNVLTFMHGCGFGIAVFERLEASDFNPNVALEVGYMLAMQKPVCILKDRKLQALQTDLMGKLYSEFDSGDPEASISQSLSAWLRDKKLA